MNLQIDPKKKKKKHTHTQAITAIRFPWIKSILMKLYEFRYKLLVRLYVDLMN